MHHPREPYASEWPLGLMLDEVWLRGRRTLVHTLERSGVWPERAQHQIFMQEQYALGERLKRELLRQVVGPSDYACLNSETIFGASNQRFRMRLPFVMAFGYALGAGLYNLLDDQTDEAANVAELCAVFNLGISVFDLVYDHFPDLFSEFSEIFNERTLRQLEADPAAWRTLETSTQDISAGELRILLKVISWFFARLHFLAEAPRRNDGWDNLAALLFEAYQAELCSANVGLDATADPVQVARAKSTLPFAVINQVVRLFVGKVDREAATAIDALVTNVAITFWLVDDLVDLVPDVQAGALNAILPRADAIRQGWEPADVYPVLAELLAGNAIEGAVKTVRTSLDAVGDILQSGAVRCEVAAEFRQVVFCYTRNWLE